jgi:hypothetical protein
MFITDALNIADEVESVAAMTEDQALDLLTRYPGLIGGVLLFLASGFLFFIGAILGIISLFSQNRKKLFPILGTVLNAFPIAVMILLTAGITMIG